MILEKAVVLSHESAAGAYRVLTLKSKGISSLVKPGQFVHVLVPGLNNTVLRRPFSVFDAKAGRLTIMYKVVGAGTRALSDAKIGAELNILGPLGNGFPSLGEGAFPVLVGGGYGIAALHLFAARSSLKGVIFIGAGCASDLLCADAFKRLGWDSRTATDDGSAGEKGLITDLLDDWLADRKGAGRVPEFFACGPCGMLRAVGERAIKGGWKAWLSMEQHMGCGVGACLGCVLKVRDDSREVEEPDGSDDGGFQWARVCADGPVFECRDIIWENKNSAK